MNSESVSPDIKLETLYDHYKDTFTYIREYLKLRDRLFIFVLLVVAAMFLFIAVPESSLDAVSQIIKEQLKLQVAFSKGFIDSVLWFLLLTLVIRYYQTTTLIERQYKYIHKVEENLCSLVGKELFYREGMAYLKDYPAFSDWVWFLYTVFFPILLIIVATFKWIVELNGIFSFTLISDTIIWGMVIISTRLHLISIHSSIGNMFKSVYRLLKK